VIARPDPMSARPLSALLLLTACAAPPVDQPDYAPREVATLARWDVESAGRLLGQVVEFEIRDPVEPVRFYRIVDAAGRWVGHATANGRFSRRVPFDDDGEDLGVLSMRRGVALLFDASAPVTLKPVAVDADWRARDR